MNLLRPQPRPALKRRRIDRSPRSIWCSCVRVQKPNATVLEDPERLTLCARPISFAQSGQNSPLKQHFRTQMRHLKISSSRHHHEDREKATPFCRFAEALLVWSLDVSEQRRLPAAPQLPSLTNLTDGRQARSSRLLWKPVSCFWV